MRREMKRMRKAKGRTKEKRMKKGKRRENRRAWEKRGI